MGRSDGCAASASSRRGSALPWHGWPLWRHSRCPSTGRSAAASARSRAAEEAVRSAFQNLALRLALSLALSLALLLTLTLTLTLTRHALLFFGFCGTGFYGLQADPYPSPDPDPDHEPGP